MELSTADGEDAINKLLEYINNQPQILKIKDGMVKNMEERITENEKTLIQIDTLIGNYSKNINTATKTADRLTFYNNQNNLNVNGALELKNTLIEETEALKNEYLTYSDAAVVISDIQTIKDDSFLDNKSLVYPLVLVFVFLVLAFIRFTYITLRTQLVQEQLLD